MRFHTWQDMPPSTGSGWSWRTDRENSFMIKMSAILGSFRGLSKNVWFWVCCIGLTLLKHVSDNTSPGPSNITSNSISRTSFPLLAEGKWCLRRSKMGKDLLAPSDSTTMHEAQPCREAVGGPWNVHSIHFLPYSLSQPMQLETPGRANKDLNVHHRSDRWYERLTGLKILHGPRGMTALVSRSRQEKGEK